MKRNSITKFTKSLFSSKIKFDINMFKNLNKNALIKLNQDISVLTLPGDYTDIGLMTNKLFIRSFYPKLFEKIRSVQRSVLIGNPGIGKSTFQFYFIARLLSPEIFSDPIPKDCYGETTTPKSIIRQEGDIFHLFDLEKNSYERGGLLFFYDYLDKNTSYLKKSLYLFEPLSTINSPFYNHRIPTLATLSPDERRYKEFCKNYGVKFFMPVFTLSELITIGDYMINSKASNVSNIVTPEHSYSSSAISYEQLNDSNLVPPELQK